MSRSAADVLGQPLALPCGAVLPNRLAKSAMSERVAGAGGAPNERHRRLYHAWGEGGAGLVVTGNVMVDADAIAESGNVVVEDDRHLEALRTWAASTGTTPTWVQINHPGRQVPRLMSWRPVAPSAVPMRGFFGMFAKPRALEVAEIEQIVERFARTAEIVRAAGFDGVQIHAAHGYLVSQFLSPRTNLRQDDWGGTPERRRRFLIEVVRAVRAAVGSDCPVAVKLNSADFQRGGFDEAESTQVIAALEAEGIDLLEISGGTYESAAMFAESAPAESTRRREAFFIEYAERVRALTKLPLMVTGGFRHAAAMAEAVTGGAVDVVGLARPLAVQPGLPGAILRGELDRALPISLTTGWKTFDTIVQGSWYQSQIRRMAEGKPPNPRLGRLRAALAYLAPPPRAPASLEPEPR